MTQMNDRGMQVGTQRGTHDPQNILTRSAIGLIIALILQYVLGMINNLFVTFPETNEISRLWIFALTNVTEVLHIIIGVGLLLGATSLIIRAMRAKQRTWVIVSATGLAGIVISIFGGALFVTTQADAYSLVMSYAFLVSLIAYGWGLFAARK